MLSLDTVEEVQDKYTPLQSSRRKNILSQEEAHFWFKYDWTSGKLKHRWSHYLRKDLAGWIDNNAWKFTLLGKHYHSATTIWTLFFDEVPSDFIIDYKDGDPLNTKIENLFIRHYSFIVRKQSHLPMNRVEKSFVGVSFVSNDDREGWQAKFKGHSSFGGVSKTGPLRTSAEEARKDYVKFKTEYMRGLFVYPVWDQSEVISIQCERLLDDDMVEYFNSLPIEQYQIKYCYKDLYLKNKILPDTYGLGDCLNLNHPLIQKYFKIYSKVFKVRDTHLKNSEKKRLKDLLQATQTIHKFPLKQRMRFEETLNFLSFMKLRGLTATWKEEDKQLLNRALKALILSNEKEG